MTYNINSMAEICPILSSKPEYMFNCEIFDITKFHLFYPRTSKCAMVAVYEYGKNVYSVANWIWRDITHMTLKDDRMFHISYDGADLAEIRQMYTAIDEVVLENKDYILKDVPDQLRNAYVHEKLVDTLDIMHPTKNFKEFRKEGNSIVECKRGSYIYATDMEISVRIGNVIVDHDKKSFGMHHSCMSILCKKIRPQFTTFPQLFSSVLIDDDE